jgi:predicted Zn-dependent peptidase
MEYKLKQGVTAYIEPSDKYKTVLIQYKFRTSFGGKTATERSLVKNMLETNSKQYPSQNEMDLKMASLYGATLHTQSQRFGKQHVVTMSLSVVNDKFIGGDDTLLEEAFAFLEEIIFRPNAEDGKFHEKTFLREKENLNNYFESLIEDKSAYARTRLNQVLFEGTDQAYQGIGDASFLENITSGNLFECYEEMIGSNQLDILVSGDVAPERILNILAAQKLSDRKETEKEVFYFRVKNTEPVASSESQDINQGKLFFGFSSPVYYMNEYYFAGLVFDGLFGGFPHSKLFQNVREKESLAYSASSGLDFLRGVMTVGTGIEFDKREQVEKIVLAQLQDMQAGDFSDALIAQTKSMLTNHYKQNDDYQGRSLAKQYQDILIIENPLSQEQWIAGLNAVTKEQIIAVAEKMTLQAIFFLKGEATDE